MKTIKNTLKKIISPSVRFEINQNKERLSQFIKGLFFWKWESYKFQLSETNFTSIHYLGRPEHKSSLMALLGINELKQASNQKNSASAEIAYASQFPMRDCLCLPFCLTTIVKLNRSVDEILATYSRSLRRSITSQRNQYHYNAVEDIVKIDAIELEMLRPYAKARHDIGASQLDDGIVRKLAKPEYGRLDLLYQGEDEVGCHLGNSYMRKGKRYWQVNRLGYPESVFSDYKRWGEVNSINLHLALEAAVKEGYDYCDYGMSLARPGAGLIEWKRRRKGCLAIYDNFNYFYLKLPKIGAAQFLWDAPLLAVEKKQVTLHLGIPENKTDDEIAARYHEMGYGGLYKVYLQCTKPPSNQVIEAIRNLYSDQEFPPMVITYMVQ